MRRGGHHGGQLTCRGALILRSGTWGRRGAPGRGTDARGPGCGGLALLGVVGAGGGRWLGRGAGVAGGEEAGGGGWGGLSGAFMWLGLGPVCLGAWGLFFWGV